MSMEPIHEHDCPVCTYLTTLDGYDLYVCINEHHPHFSSCIARFDDDGPAYVSSPTCTIEKQNHSMVRIAYELARSRSLIE